MNPRRTTTEWEAIYRKNIERVKAGAFPDPVSTCGTPHGFPRIMNVPDVYEFAVTPQATWILAENGPGILRVYTDGRSYPAKGRSLAHLHRRVDRPLGG